jgi:hypothetical protein
MRETEILLASFNVIEQFVTETITGQSSSEINPSAACQQLLMLPVT